jgi:hypothetical protein
MMKARSSIEEPKCTIRRESTALSRRRKTKCKQTKMMARKASKMRGIQIVSRFTPKSVIVWVSGKRVQSLKSLI